MSSASIEPKDDLDQIKLDDENREASTKGESDFSSHKLDHNLVLNTKESIYELYKPVIYELEQYCGNLKNSQMLLNRQLEDFFQLLRDLKFKLENDKLAEQLDENAKKVIVIKRKLTLIHTIIQNSDDRCKRLITKYSSKDSSKDNPNNDANLNSLINRDRI